eukprot:TRINITY_DN3980_c0_g1_i6.p1 TRINITY_DN3980_c0_g1~~TRINITY_DN3980_c0_g1_i6.p1  ORF type:complete len:2824 (-),score=668.71 TRINITY_DN3980_c0_g1_i6:1144-9054(-)
MNNNANTPWRFSTQVSVNQTVLDYSQNPPVLVLNSSPVSNNLPIVTCIKDYVNTFFVTAADPERDNLTFSLMPGELMGGGTFQNKFYTLTQPTNLQINANTGLITWNTQNLAAGFWQTQIKIADSLSYSVVDFIMDNQPVAKVCAGSCSNAGTVCTANSNCKSCSTTTNTCASSPAPFFVSPPTPSAGSVIVFTASQMNTLTVMGQSFNTRATVTVQPATTPVGATWTTTVAGNPSSTVLSWNPDPSAASTYVITLSLYDSNNVYYAGQYSFIINVKLGSCNYGTVVNTTTGTTCMCSPGFDNSTNCASCLPGYYGSQCLPCTCQQGTCVDGLAGTGTCQCYPGYSGVNCDTITYVSCNITGASVITGQLTTAEAMVSPNRLSVYMNLYNPQATLTVPVQITGLTKIDSLDFLFLIDNSRSVTAAMLTNVNSLARSLTQSLTAVTEDVQFGVATFTDRPGLTGTFSTSSLDYIFDLTLGLTASTDNFIDALGTLSANPSLGGNDTVDTRDCQLDSLFSAATSSSVGWRPTSFKIVALLTDSAYWHNTTQPGYMSIPALRAALLAANIVPIFLPVSVSAYNTLRTGLGFGLVTSAVAGTWANYYTLLNSAITTVTTTATLVSAQDQYGFAYLFNTTASPRVTIGLRFPTPAPSPPITTLPTVIVNAIGFGPITMLIQVNRAPVLTTTTFQTTRVAPVTFTVGATDADFNIMSANFTSLPFFGTFFTDSTRTTRIQLGRLYQLPISDGLISAHYVPNGVYVGNDNFTYGITDGCQYVNLGTGRITIAWAPIAPVCTNFSVSTLENIPVAIPINGTSVDYASSSITATLYSLPDSAAGSLTLSSTTTSAQLYSTVNQPSSFVTLTPVTYFFGPSGFLYRAVDPTGLSSASCFVNVTVIHVDNPPIALAPASVTVQRGTPFNITLQATDPDPGAMETFTLTAFSTGSGGTFSSGNWSATSATSTTARVIATNVRTVNRQASVIVTYLAPPTASGSNYASLSFTATDDARQTSNVITVPIAIRTSIPPVATPTTVTVQEGTTARTLFVLAGTDADAVDQNNLRVVISAIPSTGVLYDSNNNAITASQLGQIQTSSQFYYLPRAAPFFGNDSFSFQMVDLVGSLSSAIVVPISIVHVNHAPVVTFSPSTSAQETRTLITQILATDMDTATAKDVVTVYIASLPVNGLLYQAGSNTPLTANNLPILISDPSFNVHYLPPYNMWGYPLDTVTVYAWDGQNRSAPVTGQLNVYAVNRPPVVYNNYVVMSESQAPSPAPVPLQLYVLDVDTANASVSAYITQLPSSSIMSVTNSAGNPIGPNTMIAWPWIVYLQFVQYGWGVTNLQYRANDGALNSVGTGIITLNITFVNTAPTCSYTPVASGDGTVQVTRGSSTTFTLVSADPDTFQTFTFAVSSLALASGSLTYAGSPVTVPRTLASNQVSTNTFSAISMTYTPNNRASGSVMNMTFTVTDSGSLSSTCSISVVIAVNRPPTAVAPSTTPSVLESSPSLPTSTPTITMGGTDPDTADQGNLRTVIATLPSRGTLYDASTGAAITVINTVVSSNQVYYSPSPYFNGTDSYTFSAVDLVGALSAPLTVTINVIWRNFPPTASFSGVISGDQNTAIPIRGMTGVDPDEGRALTAYISSMPANGKLYQNDATTLIDTTSGPVAVTANAAASYGVVFVPTTNMYGSPLSSISFYMDDGRSLNSTSNVVTVPITVIHVNQPPTVQSGSVTFLQNITAPFVYTFSIADIDTANTSVNAIITALPAANLLTVQDSTGKTLSTSSTVAFPWTIRLVMVNPYRYGSTSLSFRANDGQLNSNAGTINIEVVHVNNPPTVSFSSAVSTPEETAVTITQIVASDVDTAQAGDVVTVYVASLPANGLLFQAGADTTVAANAFTAAQLPVLITDSSFRLQYLPPYNKWGYPLDTFTVYAFDGMVRSASATGLMNVAFVNHPPVAYSQSVTYLQNLTSPYSLAFVVTDPDTANSSISVSLTSVPDPALLIVRTPGGGQITPGVAIPFPWRVELVMVNRYNFGSTSFSFQANDGDLNSVSPGTVSVTIVHVNSPPTVSFSSAISTPEETAVTINQIVASDVDTQYASDVVTVYVASLPANGLLFQAGADTTVVANAFTSAQLPVLIADASYNLQYLPNYNKWGYPLDNFTVYAYDGFVRSSVATGLINVAFLDHPPVAAAQTVSFFQNLTSYSLTFGVTDPDTDNSGISVSLTTLPDPTLLIVRDIAGNQLAVGTPIASPWTVRLDMASPYHFGSTSLSFKANDGTSSSNTATVSITIVHVNSPPTIAFSSAISTPSETLVTITQIIASDVDTEYANDVVTVYVASLPVNGQLFQFNSNTPITTVPTLVTDASYQLQYLPNFNRWGTALDTFKVYAFDGYVTSKANASAVINVAFVDKPPMVYNSSVQLTENQTPSVTAYPVTFSVVDIDTANSSVYVYLTQLPPASMMIVADGNGQPIAKGVQILHPWTVYIQLVQYSWGVATMEFRANDNILNSVSTAIVTMDVTFVNTVPVASYTPVPTASGLISATRGGTLSLALIAQDPDTFQTFTFTITKLSVQSGTLEYAGSAVTPGVLVAVSISHHFLSLCCSHIFTFSGCRVYQYLFYRPSRVCRILRWRGCCMQHYLHRHR